MTSLKAILGACLLVAPLSTLAHPSPVSKRQGGTLDELFKANGKQYFGVATDPAINDNAIHAETAAREFGSVTAENSMKWGSLEPTRGQINWGTADALLDWSSSNGLAMRGHTLVWHSQLPEWVEGITDPGELTEVIENHVATVMGRWAGQIEHWDVLNEILAEDGSLRDSVFSRVLGEDFIGIAFRAARAADPDCRLYINDYNLDNADYAKTQGMVTLVNAQVAAGVPIDGIGSQGHLGAGMGPDYQGALELLASADVEEIAVTELDIEGASPEDYTAAVSACLNVEKCVGITVWGVSDATTWRPGDNPLLFDANYQPKEAYNAIVDLLS